MNTDNDAEKTNEVSDADRVYPHRELTGKIINAAFAVHNALGCGFLEKVYENALKYELETREIRVAAQAEIVVRYRDQEVGLYYADLVVDEKVVVEVKSVSKLEMVHQAQLMNYLRATGLKVGLLMNFAHSRLEYHRIIC